MELDTGAAVSIISDHTRRTLFPELKLKESSVILKTYTEEPMKVVGQLHVKVKYGTQEQKLVLVVVEGSGPSLFGRNWLKYLQLDWGKIASIRPSRLEPLNLLVKRHQQLFTDELDMVMSHHSNPSCKYSLKQHQDFISLAQYPLQFEQPLGRSWISLNSKALSKRSPTANGQHPLPLCQRKMADSASVVTIRSL